MSKASSKTAGKVAVKRKGGKYQMPEPLPKGEILTDLTKKQWKIGPSIGKGGFGEIYSAMEEPKGKKSFVVKIEPKENGPLFVEMHFFMKVCKSNDIEKWLKSKKLEFLGLPRYIGNGSHMHNGKQYRFIVMERLGKNLDTHIKENQNKLSPHFIFDIALQIIDALEYIHCKDYVHADIKGSNLLFGLEKGTENKVYLVDFGLASKYSSEYKPDKKCAHNGTIEFTSRDAHVGVSTRRGDLEILGYNMLRWFTSKLPWEDKLSDCTYVQQQKIKYMNNVLELMETCFHPGCISEHLQKFFQYVSIMEPTACPDYDLCRGYFQEGLKATESTGRKVKTTSPKRPVKNSPQKSKKVRKENNLEVPEKVQTVTKNGRSTAKVTDSKQSPRKDADPKPSRSLRSERNKRDNDCIFVHDSEEDEVEDEDEKKKQRRGRKRPSEDKIDSPKKR